RPPRRSSDLSSTPPRHRTRPSASSRSAARSGPNRWCCRCPPSRPRRCPHELGTDLRVRRAAARVRGARAGQGPAGGGVPHPRRPAARGGQHRPVLRGERDQPRHRRRPRRRTHGRFADAQAGLLAAHRAVPGRPVGAAAGLPAPPRRGRRGGGRPPVTDALAGYTVAVTAARRADELGSLLANRGARVVHGPALRILPLADDAELHRVSLRFLEGPPDVVVAPTGIGFRGWIAAADGGGISAELLDALRPARLLARGPKARGAVRAAGLPDPWSPGSESSAELLEHLLEQDLTGVRVAVQLHGRPLPDFVDALRCAGAEVVEVPVYRWTAPADASALEALVRSVCAREVDAVTFTSAPAAVGLLSLADELRCREELLAALRGPVLAACVGPVAHAPLADHGVPAVVPRRFRLGALVHTLCDE